jgi:excinuclease ABC subunit A
VVPVLRRQLHAAEDVPGEHRSIEGYRTLRQSDSHRSVSDRSHAAQQPGNLCESVFDEIRSLYVELPEAKRRGYQAGRFSFNVSGGPLRVVRR